MTSSEGGGEVPGPAAAPGPAAGSTKAQPVFAPVTGAPDWPALERAVLAMWRREGTFQELVSTRAGAEKWSFLDGPITANNPMGVHHAWGRTYKDVWQRFHAQMGQDGRWQNGFDCQGLWVEVEVERDLGFKSKRDIESYGIARFVARCKERVLRYAALITEQSQRLGMWAKWDDPEQLRWLADHLDEPKAIPIPTPQGPVVGVVETLVGQLGGEPWNGSYFTFSDENNYTIWTFLKRCHERGWIYKGRDVMPWCTRCGTGLSQHEIATEGYQERTHKSPTIRLPLRGKPGESLLVWTTTPWTLPGNVAAAVGPELTYLRVKQADSVYYLADGAKAALQGDYEVIGTLKGKEMVGWTYDGPFDHLPASAEAAAAAHTVIAWDEVGADEGTGIVHIAPGSGAEDFALGKLHKLPAIAPLTEDGLFVAGFDWLTGRSAHDVAADILADLEARDLLYKVEAYTHRYPVCWRCQTELVFRLVDEWFISMGEMYDKPRESLTAAEKAASLRYQVMDVAEQARWIPAFGRERELDWLRNMHDWMISKKRYWGLALPIWVCEDCGAFDVIGSREELAARATSGWDAFDGHSPHRPHVDAVLVACKECGANAKRIPDVGNPWLDAGSVPFSTMRYNTDRAYWADWYPAAFITESFPGQFRNWFYSVLVMATVFENSTPVEAILGYGTLVAEDGREMHKSWGNSIEFNEAADQIGADVMRWMYMGHRLEQNLRFGYHGAAEVRRRFLLPLWNVYSFFVQYANATPWAPNAAHLAAHHLPGASDKNSEKGAGAAEAASEMDRWIRLRAAETCEGIARRLDDYDPPAAVELAEEFLEDLSNWYVRRSRRRFWEGDPAALACLHEVLLDFVKVLAPSVPFTAEALYQNLAQHRDVVAGSAPSATTAPHSVHLTHWPRTRPRSATDEGLLRDMRVVIRLAGLGRAARSAADVKLRQPLSKAMIAVPGEEEAAAVARLEALLADELNVKRVEVVSEEGELVTYTVRPVLPVLGPKYGQRVAAIRQALAAADPAEVAADVRAGLEVPLTLADGEVVTLEPLEVEVMASARPGLATAEEQGYVVGLAVELSAELMAEGAARDLIRSVNQLRKDAGFDISDRVRLAVDAEGDLVAAVEAWREVIAAETLAVAVELGPPGNGAATAEAQVLGTTVRLGVTRA